MGDENPASTPSRSPRANSPPTKVEVVGNGMTVQQCQDIIDKSFQQNPKVKFLVESMEKSGCKIGPNFVKAYRCRTPHAGGFSRGHDISICANYANFKDEVVQTVIHELIHVYDDCRAANVNWHRSDHQACSEIRANHLSGDCHYVREFLRGHLQRNGMTIKGHEPVCVKRRSTASVSANHPPEVAKAAVEAVWGTCYNDTAPFGKIP